MVSREKKVQIEKNVFLSFLVVASYSGFLVFVSLFNSLGGFYTSMGRRVDVSTRRRVHSDPPPQSENQSETRINQSETSQKPS